MLSHMPRQGLYSQSFQWQGACLHAAQTFTTSSLICLGSLLIRSISLVWLSFTIFSSLVLYWYWSAFVGLQVLDGPETVRVNLPGSNCPQPPQFSSEPLYHHCDAPSGMPVDSCCRRPGKNGGLTPTLHTHKRPHTHTESVHIHTHTHTQCNAHRQKRHALKENPGLCHISHGVVGLTRQGLHSGTNFHHRVRQWAQTHPPALALVGTQCFVLMLHLKIKKQKTEKTNADKK